ncbi:restriction endonuclease subunit S [Arcobacter sp. YIC-464]|uniref:restriction endonuclease subunit S n=1 Tax=Arcobacter sp. YIC-464 TaxID=3376631 RepID=UPI003C1D385E
MLTDKKIKTFTSEPYNFISGEILERNFSFSPQSHRQISVPSVNYVPLSSLIEKKQKGFEPGSADYITFGDNHFVRISEMSDTDFTFSISNQTKKLLPQEKGSLINEGDLCYQTASNVGNVCFYYGKKAFYNSHILKLELKEEDKFYIFGILKSAYNKEQVDIGGSIKGLDNFSEDFLNNTMIPMPKNQESKKLLSLIVQNIIDKEQQIKLKNKEINSLIKNELETHSHTELKMPVSNEVLQNNFRFDSGLYSPEYKAIKESIEFYEGGYFNLLDHYNSKRGQNLQVSNIGISIYTNEKKDNFYRLVTNVEFTEDRTISTFRYLGNKKDLTLIPNDCIMLSADGSVGRCIYVDDLGKTITNIHPWILTAKDKNRAKHKNIFTAMFLGYLRTVGYYEKIQDKSNGGGIKAPHLENWIKIPEFPDTLQCIISKKYHNKIDRNKDLTLENYLGKEKERNAKLGIWQLNMELFDLKDQIENLVHDIVYDIEIKIEDYLQKQED